MHRIIAFALLALSAQAAPPYATDLRKWIEVPVPPESDQVRSQIWWYAANYSQDEWQVFTKGGFSHARLISQSSVISGEHPAFTPAAGEFKGASAFAHVDDGWLVGFNKGEFGASLFWFSADGKRNYKISDHQVVDFFRLADGVYAIEGLAHLGMSEGSIIRITRSDPKSRWQARTVVRLPFAPEAISLTQNGTMLITLSDELVAADGQHKIRTLLKQASWGQLYPNSSVLADHDQKLYIGMRQYVAEFDLRTKKLRFLVPSTQFINKLTKEREQEISSGH